MARWGIYRRALQNKFNRCVTSKTLKENYLFHSRHWCDQNDNLPTYSWLRHDGFTFGEQLISDPPHDIITSFVKTPGGEHGGHWTARINVTSKVWT